LILLGVLEVLYATLIIFVDNNNNNYYQQWSRIHYSTPHTLWALTVATILADAAVTPPSPKWPKLCRVGR